MRDELPRIVFMGSPEIAVPAFRALAASYPMAGVVTQPDRPAGRGKKLLAPAVKDVAVELGIPVFQPQKLREPGAIELLSEWNPDLIVVMAYGQILRKNVLELPRFGCINVHASLLPRWRGASPIQSALLAGDSQTGVSIMKMDAGMDTGPVLNTKAVAIDPKDTAATLSEKIAILGAELLLATLPDYLNGSVLPIPQSESGITYASLIDKKDGLLDFSQPAEELERKVRAFNPWPSAFFYVDDVMVKVHQAHVEKEEQEMEIGKRCLKNGLPAIMTGDGFLVLDEIQCSGKKAMNCKAFLAGNRGWFE